MGFFIEESFASEAKQLFGKKLCRACQKTNKSMRHWKISITFVKKADLYGRVFCGLSRVALCCLGGVTAPHLQLSRPTRNSQRRRRQAKKKSGHPMWEMKGWLVRPSKNGNGIPSSESSQSSSGSHPFFFRTCCFFFSGKKVVEMSTRERERGRDCIGAAA